MKRLACKPASKKKIEGRGSNHLAPLCSREEWLHTPEGNGRIWPWFSNFGGGFEKGEDHNMASMDSKAYKGMLRLALDGDLAAVVGGPNCRSRSILRHYPGGPRPVRSWEEPWGTSQLTEEELNMCLENDIMMWRQIFLYLAAEMSRKLQEVAATDGSNEKNHEFLFLLEQPSDPVDYKPEYVSFWRTKE